MGLTKEQRKFILLFFANEKYAGWKNIAEHLIDRGSVVVAGTECIWVGMMGNFIELSKAKGSVGCSLYTFDLEEFLSSEYFKQNYIRKIEEYEKALEEKRKQVNDLIGLI